MTEKKISFCESKVIQQCSVLGSSKMAEPVPTRIWAHLRTDRSRKDEKGKIITGPEGYLEPPDTVSSEGQKCMSFKDVLRYVTAKELTGTRTEYYHYDYTVNISILFKVQFTDRS